MLTTVAATLVSLSALGAALPVQQARSFEISDFGGHDLDLGDYGHGYDSHISFGHGYNDYDLGGYYGYGHGDSFHGFDDFYGHDNFDSSHNVRHVVEEHHVVCHTEKVVIIQQRLAVIHELAKRIITEQICEVETQTVVLEQWRSSIDVFHHDVHHFDGSHPGYDSHIASLYPDLFNHDGSLSTNDLGFSGSDVGSSYLIPSGSNWDDSTSPASVQGAFQAAQSANAATSALPPSDDSASADNTAPPADGDNTAPPADGDNTAPPADGDNTAPPADGDNTAAPAASAAAGGISVTPDDGNTALAPAATPAAAAPAPAAPSPAKGVTPAVPKPAPAPAAPAPAAPAPAAPATKA